MIIYNALGQRVKTLFSARQTAGEHRARWDAKDQSGRPVSSGVYFYRVTAGQNSAVKKMLLAR
ncbi:MAG: FlgD immunoglobulin-like domain containing protein [Calditrichia bacterium]